MARSREDWRRRLAGEVAFDEAAAEAAIEAVYRASALPEPCHVLWLDGPRQAAQAVEFLRNPPRRQSPWNQEGPQFLGLMNGLRFAGRKTHLGMSP